MKRLFCLLLIFTTITLCGCTVAKTEEETTETSLQTESISYTSRIIDESDYFTVINNGDFTYSYEIRDKSGNIILSDNSEKRTPHINMMDENTVKLMIQRGTGISTQITFFVNVETGMVSEDFISVFDEYNGRIAYHLYQNSKHYMIVRDIFDKEAFYKEFEIDDDIYAVADAVVSADFSQDGKKLTVIYLAGEDYKETETVFFIE